MQRPRIVVYDKNMARVGWLGGWTRLVVQLAHNAISTAEITIPWQKMDGQGWALAEGARVTIEVTDPDGKPWTLMSGPIIRPDGLGPTAAGTLKLRVESDFRMLAGLPCWPVAGASLAAQTRAERVVTGTAEAVFLQIVRENIARLGWPLSTGSSLGRGGSATARVRFDTAADALVPLLDAVGLGVDIVQKPWPATGFSLSVYQTRVFAQKLTEKSEVLTGWQWSRTAPEFTRCVVAGPGEGTGRLLVQVVNESAEAAWGPSLGKLEAFVDARDLGSAWSEALRDLPDRREDLTEARADLRAAQNKRDALTRRYIDLDRAAARAQRTWESAPAGAQKDAAATNLSEARADRADANVDRVEAETELAAAVTAYNQAVTALGRAEDAIVTTRAQAVAEMQQRGRERLHEANTKAGIAVTVSETDNFRVHPGTIWRGDQVTADTGAGIAHTDVIRTVSLSWTPEDGYRAVPTVGERADSKPMGQLVYLLAAIGRRMRKKATDQ
ncbi:Gp37-like protein [Auraticoccus monumenti]|uniref:Virus ReqiPepy6 Gp37-like protein n=1 Tax=Auraticoccus monumenti TaxID=675864 RepID=A0A1G6UH47_9ACTN|nr:hypothetical protein [Auraticoccus monumenti]SDD40633.1 virus ReqiPepy6 Gp37-like protein [Auraticoccus monumenti]